MLHFVGDAKTQSYFPKAKGNQIGDILKIRKTGQNSQKIALQYAFFLGEKEA